MSERTRSERVAVIGGSLGGLAAALDMSRRGLQVTVYERDDEVLPDFEPLLAGACPAWRRLLDDVGLTPTSSHAPDVPPQVEGGTPALRMFLVEAIERAGGEVRTRATVSRLRRDGVGVRFHVVEWGLGAGVREADAVLVALNPIPAMQLLADPDGEEAELLFSVPTRVARVVRHMDHRLMPWDRSAWRADQLVAPRGRADGPLRSRTRWLNRTGEISPTAAYTFETWDPAIEPAADRILEDGPRTVPSPGAAGDAARATLTARQGTRGTWYVGGWMMSPLGPEEALSTGFAAAAQVAQRGAQLDSGCGVAFR